MRVNVGSPRRGAVSALLGIALVMLGLLGPLDAVLPGPLQDRLGSAGAIAQPSTVESGRADPCPDGYTEAGDLCRIEQPACPYSPFDSTRLMQRSTEFTEFCEETINPGEPNYDACTGPSVLPGEDPETYPGFAVMVDPITASCRMLQLRTCEVGTRIDSEWCRSTIRRSWDCPQTDAIPRNEFNSCYIVPASAMSTAAACGPGAPDLVIIDCAHYVGNDFVEPPGSVPCGSYLTGPAPALTAAANAYWCQLDPSYLTIVCHSTTPPPGECGQPLTMCLKRGSGTGGCDGIAQTMLCRSLQFDYQQQHAAAQADNVIDRTEELDLRTQSAVVRDDGCEPCLILPFEPIPPHCPDDTHATAMLHLERVYVFQAIEQQHDIENLHPACAHLNTRRPTTMVNPVDPSLDCAAIESRCDSPSAGNPVWSSSHFSGLAVVNSPVIVRLHDVPVTYRESPSSLSLEDLVNGNIPWHFEYAVFPGSGLGQGGQIVRTFSRPESTLVTDSPAMLANLSFECVATHLPVYKLIVEELWPDRPADAAAITAMFGSEALDWWTSLGSVPDGQQRRTEARGLTWWPSLTTAAGQDERIDSLETTLPCDAGQGIEVWCRWTPSRSGYFRLKVAGAWHMNIGETRGVHSQARLAKISRSVQDLTPQKRQQVRDTLAVLGCGRDRAPDPSCAWSPAAVGLKDDLSDIIPRTPDSLYRNPTEGQKYPGLDLRVRYTDLGSTTKYTETQTFGIQAHEVRVRTVAPVH